MDAAPGGGPSRCAIALALAVAVAAALGLVACAQPAYDRANACRYALEYWDKVASDGFYFADREAPTRFGPGVAVPADGTGFDCAHFVSCCIGSESNDPGGGLLVPSRTAAYGEPGAQRLVDWLIAQGATRATDVSSLAPGDVVAYDRNSDGWIDHVALYIGDGQVAAHSITRVGAWDHDAKGAVMPVRLPGTDAAPSGAGPTAWIAWAVGAVVLLGLAACVVASGAR